MKLLLIFFHITNNFTYNSIEGQKQKWSTNNYLFIIYYLTYLLHQFHPFYPPTLSILSNLFTLSISSTLVVYVNLVFIFVG